MRVPSSRRLSGRFAPLLIATWGLICFELTFPARGDVIFLTPVADTTLIETEPTNNMGGQLWVNAGTTQNYTRTRGLFRFDLTGQIPPKARVTSANLVLSVTRQPKDGFNSCAFGLHRVLKPWGEGNKTFADLTNHTSPGLGAPASTNEATWISRFAYTSNTWAKPGGAVTNDYAAAVSAEQTIYDIGNSPYTFFSTPVLVADVQSWVDDSRTNFGWLLVCSDESFNFTARRFGSREDTNNAPVLEVDFFLPPPAPQLLIIGGKAVLKFTAQPAQGYVLQYRDFLVQGGWLALTNFTPQATATNWVVRTPASGPQRFFRLGTM